MAGFRVSARLSRASNGLEEICHSEHQSTSLSSKQLTHTHHKMATTEKKKTTLFFHPDLGIGGAERLIIDAAVGLQNRGHKVVIFTSHCDPKHCFDEARDGTE